MSIEKRVFCAVIPTIYYYRRLDSSRVKKSRKERKEAYVVFNQGIQKKKDFRVAMCGMGEVIK